MQQRGDALAESIPRPAGEPGHFPCRLPLTADSKRRAALSPFTLPRGPVTAAHGWPPSALAPGPKTRVRLGRQLRSSTRRWCARRSHPVAHVHGKSQTSCRSRQWRRAASPARIRAPVGQVSATGAIGVGPDVVALSESAVAIAFPGACGFGARFALSAECHTRRAMIATSQRNVVLVGAKKIGPLARHRMAPST